ncbi:MAG: hypothetical protein H6565_06745 [Lewinellaceae bacterium]|nr:hypothetical protein [Lewinellaceae bacterium]
MNVVNKILLSAVLFPEALYRRMGVDLAQLRSILRTKLVMDDRRPNTIQASRQQRGKEEISNATLGTMLMSGLMGVAFMLTLVISSDYVTKLTLFFGVFIVMLCMSLVSDFTSVLIDIRDTNIILPKPVNDSTFVISRLLHIFIHICKIVLPMILPTVLYISFASGLFGGILVFVLAMFATLFAIFLINAIYILILRVTTPDRFKNVISYFQIVFAIAIYASYQVLPRTFDRIGDAGLNFADHNWLILTPPFWFACAFDTIITLQGSTAHWLAATLAFVVPVISIFIVIKYLAPAFNQKLAMISGSDGPAAPTTKTTAETGRQSAIDALARLVTGNSIERVGFAFTWKMMARSRDFKLRVYPSAGYFIVIIVVMIFRMDAVVRGNGSVRFFPMIILYLSSIIMIAALSQLSFSDKFKAVWMYYITPVTKPGLIISGALKAVLFQFFSIIVLFTLVSFIWMSGIGILPNLLLGISNLLVIFYGFALINFKNLPFSRPMNTSQQGGQFIRGMTILFVSGFLCVIHYFVFRHNAAIALAAAVSLGGLWLLMRRVSNIGWHEIREFD